MESPAGSDFRSIQSVSFYNLGAVVTAANSGITSTTASVSGEVVSEGKSPVTERGFVYARAPVTDPKIGDAGVTQVIDGGIGLGSFSAVLTGLTPNTAYILKSYVINEDGPTYSSGVNFSTNLPPVFVSDGGNSNVAVSVAENSSAVTTVSATDADPGQTITYSITGGADAARFAIGAASGALTFAAVPDFEAPTDADADNVYQVIVAATDNGNPPKSATQTLTITVTNVADSGEIAIEQPVDSNLAPGAAVAFGSATVGQAIDRVFTVRSSGELPLQLGNAVFSGTHAGDFSLVGPLPSDITIGGSANFTVRFRPTSSGARSAVLSLPNNDQRPGKSPFILNLSGTGSTTQVLATYATPSSQVLGGWVNAGNFTIGQVGATSPGNNWPSAEGPDKVVDNNTGSKFLHLRNNNAGVILRPTNSSVVFNRLQLFTANDAPERDPASYIIYGSASSLGGSAGTNIPISGLTKIAEGTVTLRDARGAGPTVIQFANSIAYTSYVVVFPTVRNPATSALTQISEVQLAQGIDPPFAVAMEHARGGQLVGITFSFGTIGNSNPGTNWLTGESPDHALDGNINSKFAIFRSTGAGLISSPQAGPAKVTSLTFWTANDALERDPLSYQVYGFATRVTQTSGTLDIGAAGTLLGSGSLELPAARNSGPVTVGFPNGTAYASYLVVFPAVNNSPATSLTQISEVQFGSTPFVTLAPASLAAFTADFGSPSAAQTVSLSGFNLDGNVSVTAPTGFEISQDGSTYAPSLTLVPADRALTATLSVRMAGGHTQAGQLGGSLLVETPGAAQKILPLQGTVVPSATPSVPNLAGFEAGYGGVSASQVLTVNGGGLSGALKVTAPTGFEISTDGTNFSPSLQLGTNAGTIQSVYRGEFGSYTTASGKIWNAGSGSEFPISSAFAAITSTGAVVTWGNNGNGGNSSSVSSQLGSGVTAVYSTRNAFAAVKADGSVVTWGDSSNGGNSSAVASQLSSGVISVSSTSGAFAAQKADGSVVTWGNTFYGADSSSVADQLSSGVTAVYSNASGFAALKTDSSLVTWGSATYGGDSSASDIASRLSSGVMAVYSTNLAFAALKTNGSIVTWGSATDGGDSSAVSSQLSSEVTAVFSTERAFAALKSNGSVVTWGRADFGGNPGAAVSSQLGSFVTKVFSNERAFAALKTDGSVVTWGGDNYGNNSSAVASQLGSGVTAVYSNKSSFAALKTGGSIVTWGFAGNGGDSRSVSDQLDSGVTAVYSTDSAFAALKADGSVVTWGFAGSGGDSSVIAGQLRSGVRRVHSSVFAFAALKEDGSVVTWGDANSGGSGGPANIGAAIPATLPITLHVRLAATAPAGTVSGQLELTSSGIATQTVALSGTVVPVLTPASNSLAGFQASPGSASITQSVTLNGGGFTSPITVSAPAGFEVSENGTDFSSSVRLGKNAGTIQSVYRGEFKDYTTGSGSIWFAGSGQEFPSLNTFAAITSDGSVVTWGLSYGQLPSGLGANVEAVYSNHNAFAALKSDGSVVTWGDAGYGGNSISVAAQLSSAVTAVHSSGQAFAAVKADGSVVTWGAADYGGDSSSVAASLSSKVVRVFSTQLAFAALKSDGSVVTWGRNDSGGNSSGVSDRLSSDVVAVFSNSFAFAALKRDGSLVTWGESLFGGNSSSVADKLGSGVTAVYATARAFAATKTDGSVVTWGDATIGGNSSGVVDKLASDVTAVYSARFAFAALKKNGSVVTWGSGSSGGNSSSVASKLSSKVTAVYSTEKAFAALKSDGSVVTWGDSNSGANSSSVAEMLSSNVAALYSTSGAFAALKRDGSVVTWGASGYGGDSSGVANSLTADVKDVYSTYSAFAALKGNGSVVAWGDSMTGGSGGPGKIGVAELPTFPATLHIRLAATAPAGTVSGELTLSSSGFTTQSVALSGTVSTPGATPSAPTSLVASPGDGEVSLAFTAGADAGSAITNYEFSTDNGTNWSAFNPVVTSSPVVITGLTNGTAYSIRLRAVNANGQGAASEAVSATPVAPPAPPSFAGYAVTVKQGKTLALSPAKLLARTTDPDGGAVTLTEVFGPSAQGGTVSLTGTLNYTPPTSFTGTDSFDIELTGSQGGILRATVTVTVTGNTAAGQNLTELRLRDGKVDLTFRGIPGRSYTVQRSTNLSTWTTLATVVAGADGRITYTDPAPPQPSGYYRVQF